MGRMRTLKPDFFRSRSLARVPMAARLTFQGLWCEADDHGRGIADARLLKGSVWPLEDEMTSAEVAAHLGDLERTGHIRLYEIAGEAYYEICSWEEHQAAAYRRGDAIHPLPPAHTPSPDMPHDQSCEKVRAARPDVLEVEVEVEQGTGNREQGSPVSDTFGADVPRLCEKLADRVEANGSKRPTVTKAWLTECDRMLRLDGRTAEQVERAIDWCQSDDFWRSNVLSMLKLREKFDQMRLAAQRSNGSRAPNGRRSNLTVLRELAEADEMAG